MHYVAFHKATNGQTDIYIYIQHENDDNLAQSGNLVEKRPPSRRSSLQMNVIGKIPLVLNAQSIAKAFLFFVCIIA